MRATCARRMTVGESNCGSRVRYDDGDFQGGIPLEPDRKGVDTFAKKRMFFSYSHGILTVVIGYQIACLFFFQRRFFERSNEHIAPNGRLPTLTSFGRPPDSQKIVQGAFTCVRDSPWKSPQPRNVYFKSSFFFTQCLRLYNNGWCANIAQVENCNPSGKRMWT